VVSDDSRHCLERTLEEVEEPAISAHALWFAYYDFCQVHQTLRVTQQRKRALQITLGRWKTTRRPSRSSKAGSGVLHRFDTLIEKALTFFRRLAAKSVAAGSSDTTLQVVGASFTPQSIVNFGNQPLQTAYVSATQISAVVPSSQLAAAENRLFWKVSS
jgi:hypothetical protein